MGIAIYVSKDGTNFDLTPVYNDVAQKIQVADIDNKIYMYVSKDGTNFDLTPVYNDVAQKIQVADLDSKGSKAIWVSKDGKNYESNPVYTGDALNLQVVKSNDKKSILVSKDGKNYESNPVYTGDALNFRIDFMTATVDPEPEKPTEGQAQPEKGGNQDATKWVVKKMENDPNKWKVTDSSGVNIADQFTSQPSGEKYITWHKWNQKNRSSKVHPLKIGSENLDGNGVKIMRKIKQGGKSITKTSVERSEHDQSNENDIQRDSIYGDPKFIEEDIVNFATVMYIKTRLSARDQVDTKRDGGRHSKDSDQIAKQGRSYAMGVEITPGNPSEPFMAKEFPKHSDTPKVSKQVTKVYTQELPDLNDKFFGLQTISWVTPNRTKMFECYLDLSVLDKNPEEVTSPPNEWTLYFTIEDNGSWKEDGKPRNALREPYLTNQGLANGGQNMYVYGRIDHVTYGTIAKFAGSTEIEPVTS